MKAIYTVRPGLTIEVEGESQRDLFRELSGATEVFGEVCCGACLEKAILPIARTAQNFEFFEWACTNPKCGARLSMGVRKEGGHLFAKRRLDARGRPVAPDEAGEVNDTRGWTTFRGDAEPAASNGGPRTPAPAAVPAKPAAPSPAAGNDGYIDAAQWDSIKQALTRSKVGQQTFLRWAGYQTPHVIPAKLFDRLLQAASAPPRDLLAQAAGPAQTGGRK